MRMPTFMDAQLHIRTLNTELHPPHPTLGCNCAWMCAFPGATDADSDGQMWRRGGAVDGEDGGVAYKDGSRCYNNCLAYGSLVVFAVD